MRRSGRVAPCCPFSALSTCPASLSQARLWTLSETHSSCFTTGRLHDYPDGGFFSPRDRARVVPTSSRLHELHEDEDLPEETPARFGRERRKGVVLEAPGVTLVK